MKKTLYLITLICGLAFAAASCSHDDEDLEYDYLAVKLVGSDAWSILNTETGEILHEDDFKEQPSIIYHGVFVVKNEDGTFDYYSVDDTKKPINKEPYYMAMDFNGSDRTFATKPGGRITIINTDCEELATLSDDIVRVWHLQHGYAFYVDASNKVGLIDDDGKIVVKAKYDNAMGTIGDGIAIFSKQDMAKDKTTYYAVDMDGKELFSLKSDVYKAVGYFSEGKLPVVKDGEVIMLNKEGKKLYKLFDIDDNEERLARHLSTHNGKTIFKDGSSWGLKDDKGEILIRAKYDDLTTSYGDYYIAERDDDYGLINTKDETVIDFKYKGLFGVRSDRYIAKSDDTYTLINDKGEDATTQSFDDVSVATYDIVRTNYIDPKAYAEKIAKDFTDESCCGYTKSTTVGSLRGTQLTASEYAYSDEYYANVNFANNADRTCSILFNGPIASEQYSYENIYGYTYRTSNGYAFNDSTTIRGVAVGYDLTEFPAVEDKVAAEFDKLLKGKGYTAVSNTDALFRSPKGSIVGLGYEDGQLQLFYYFEGNEYVDLTREKRSSKGSSSTFETATNTDKVK